MINLFSPLDIRKKLGRDVWGPPREIVRGQWAFKTAFGSIIVVSSAPYPVSDQEPEVEFLHASISHLNRMPTYEDLIHLHSAVFNDGWAYQIFAPRHRHINIHNYALHLWGRLDGKMLHPDFQQISGINQV